jgi:cysteine desulfurase
LLPVDGEGRIRLEDLESALTPETGLVSIMHGNNEIGTLQPIEEIGAYLQRQEVFFHTDAVQTVGKVPIDLSRLPVDALTLSAHKLYGPKGVGALYVRPGAPNPQPLLMGGGQQNNLRSGTENVAGIVGLAAALEICVAQMPQETARQFKLMQFLIETLEAKIPTAVLNGPRMPSKRVPGNVHFSFPPLGGDALVLQMDLRGFAVSSGSACHSAVIEPSHVVLALGKSREIAQGTLRFSLGRNTTEGQLQEAVSALCTIVERLSERASQPISSS